MRRSTRASAQSDIVVHIIIIIITIIIINEHREIRPKASSSVVEYPILIAYPSMYGMLKVCSVKDLLFRISSTRVKSSL